MLKLFMKVKIVSIILVLTILFPILSPLSALAETTGLKATDFYVSVRPEYDDPRTLVIYEGKFINSGTEIIKKNTPISFIIPKDAEIGMACEINAQGGHDCQPYTTKDLGDNKVQLSWNITKDLQPNQGYPVFLEFYYDNKAAAPNKTFDYTFTPTYNLDSLNLIVTAPKESSSFAISPSAPRVERNQEELNNYYYNFPNKASGDTVTLQVSYIKNDNKPTFDKPQTGDNGATTSNKLKSSINNPGLLVGMLIFLLLLIVLLVYSFKKPGSPPVPPKGKGAQQKKKIRQMLLDGKISEETYKEMLKDLKE